MGESTYTGKPNTLPFPKGKYVVVGEDQVGELTEAGGHIMQVMPTQRMAYIPTAINCPSCLYPVRVSVSYGKVFASCCNKQFAVDVSQPEYINTNSFLIMIDSDQVYEELRQKHLAAERDALAEQMKSLQLEKSLEEARTQLRSACEDRAAALIRLEELKRELHSARNDLNGSARVVASSPKGTFG